jgi:hypothetical protein
VGRGADRRLDHHQQLHQHVVGGHALALGSADRLDDEDVGAADRIGVAAVDLAVRERLQPGVGQLHAEPLGDAQPELAARAPGGDHHPLVVADRKALGSQDRLGLQGRHPSSSSFSLVRSA